jgi:hypothetical protein
MKASGRFWSYATLGCLLLAGCAQPYVIQSQRAWTYTEANVLSDHTICERTATGLGTDAENQVAVARGLKCYKDHRASFDPKKANVASAQKAPVKAGKTSPDVAITPKASLSSSQIKTAELEAITICSDRVQRSLHFPSSYDRQYFGTASKMLTNGTIVVEVPFEAKNGFGMELPQIARCLVANGSVIMLDVQNR